MERLEFIDDNGEKTQFYVIEEDSELEAVGKVFSELMDDDVELK